MRIENKHTQKSQRQNYSKISKKVRRRGEMSKMLKRPALKVTSQYWLYLSPILHALACNIISILRFLHFSQ